MPIMPRSDKKASKIAFSILGVPSNFKQPKKKRRFSGQQKSSAGYEELSRINMRGMPRYT